jgi:hypothetical protein
MSDNGTIDNPDVAGAARALFAWYAAMGVDTVVGDEPVDRFAVSAARLERSARPPVATSAAAPPPGGGGGRPPPPPPPPPPRRRPDPTRPRAPRRPSRATRP